MKDIKFGYYDVACVDLDKGLYIIQIIAMSEQDAINIALIKGHNAKDAVLSL